MSYWYLASPYANVDNLEDKSLPRARARDVGRLAAELIENKIIVYCPILVSQALKDLYPSLYVTMDHAKWLEMDKNFLKSADGMLIYTLDGWEKSKGIAEEKALAEELSMNIIHITPNANVRRVVRYLKGFDDVDF